MPPDMPVVMVVVGVVVVVVVVVVGRQYLGLPIESRACAYLRYLSRPYSYDA